MELGSGIANIYIKHLSNKLILHNLDFEEIVIYKLLMK